MLHTKFRGNRPAGSGEEDFKGFTIYGHGGHPCHKNSIKLINFQFHVHVPESLHIKFC